MPKKGWGWFGAIAALLTAGALYLQFSGTPPGDLLELVAEGGEKILRPEMRAARGAPRVLIFALDGVGDDELRAAIRSGRMPQIAALVGPETTDGGYEHAYAANGALSILPSTTVAAWASLFSGEGPAQTGVPGNEWFVREEMKYYAPAPVSVTDNAHALQVYTDDIVGQALRVPTLFELVDLRSYVSLSQIYRGADLLTTPDPGALGDLVSAFAEGVVDDEGIEPEIYEALDRSAVQSLIGTIQERGVADLQVVYLPGVDLYTHVAENPLVAQSAYLERVLDGLVGRILLEYRDQNALDETYVLFVSDHGHTPVLDDDRHSLGAEPDDEPTALIEAAGFRLRPLVIDPSEGEQDYQAAVAYQGAFAYVYLADRSSCPVEGDVCDWRRPPRLEEDVLPLVRAYDNANRTGAGVPELQGTLDLILSREPRPYDVPSLPFQIWDGERLIPIADYLELNPRPDLLDFERRMESLAAGPYGHRAGDVLLLARSGAERPIEERFYFSGVYRSWHGSPSAQDSRISLVVARPSGSGAEIRDRVVRAVGENPSQLDITPLVRALLQEEPR